LYLLRSGVLVTSATGLLTGSSGSLTFKVTNSGAYYIDNAATYQPLVQSGNNGTTKVDTNPCY
jgi:hypothetical protein